MGDFPWSLDWEAEVEGRRGIKSMKKKKHLLGRRVFRETTQPDSLRAGISSVTAEG